MLHGREPRHLDADLADDRQRRHRLDPLDFRQVDPHRIVQRRAHIKTRMVRLAATRTLARLQGRQSAVLLHPTQLLFDLCVELVQLLLVKLPGRERQLQLIQMLVAIRTRQRLRDLLFAGLDPRIAILRQLHRITRATQDRLDNRLPRHAGDVADQDTEAPNASPATRMDSLPLVPWTMTASAWKSAPPMRNLELLSPPHRLTCSTRDWELASKVASPL